MRAKKPMICLRCKLFTIWVIHFKTRTIYKLYVIWNCMYSGDDDGMCVPFILCGARFASCVKAKKKRAFIRIEMDPQKESFTIVRSSPFAIATATNKQIPPICRWIEISVEWIGTVLNRAWRRERPRNKWLQQYVRECWPCNGMGGCIVFRH